MLVPGSAPSHRSFRTSSASETDPRRETDPARSPSRYGSGTRVSSDISPERRMSMKTVNIREVAQVVRSKNAGPFRLTLDILFRDRAVYEQVKRSGSITAATIAALYNLPVERVTDF